MKTPLQDVPREWLINFEPRVARGRSFGDCWLWTGALAPDGHAVLSGRGHTGKKYMKRAARIVMAMFWDFEPHNDVVHSCGNGTCLNPAHLQVRLDHHKQRKTAVFDTES
jgi:hypothetical protein